MSRQQSTGVLRLSFVPSVANKSAPTTTEINAGTDLTAFLKRDGLTTPKSGKTISLADVSSPFDKTGAGTYGGDAMTLKFYRDSVSGSDTAWSTLVPLSAAAPAGTEGFLVVRRFGGASVAFATGNVVEVWPVSVISREMDAIAENEAQSFTVMCAVTDEPDDGAVVA